MTSVHKPPATVMETAAPGAKKRRSVGVQTGAPAAGQRRLIPTQRKGDDSSLIARVIVDDITCSDNLSVHLLLILKTFYPKWVIINYFSFDVFIFRDLWEVQRIRDNVNTSIWLDALTSISRH
jgi:hypothetical protein